MRVLIVTETDACCGPMAAAFIRDYVPSWDVVSVGRNPAKSIDSMVVAAMRECLIDLKDYQPRDLKSVEVSTFDAVYECPDLLSPKTMDEFRQLRDFVKNEAYLFFRNYL